jgi:hypothetical protein
MVAVWSKTARAELQKAYLFIQLDSQRNAEIVRDDLIDLTIELCKQSIPRISLKRITMEHGELLKSTIIVFLTGLLHPKFVSFVCVI